MTRGRMVGRQAPLALTAALLGVLAACQSLPDIPDRRAAASGPKYRFAELKKGKGNTDGILVLLAFSGGGARAAAMAYGVLEALNATQIGRPGLRRSLLSEVDVISGTSGGSFTAAFYGLYRDRMFEPGDDGLAFYESRYLKRRVTKDLKKTVLWNLIRINTSAVNRSDVAAELYQRDIFGPKTFADLQAKGRPLIAINTNDTTKLSRFVFTQDQFDLICGDLAAFPVARAVTASSAVHGVFAPIKLRNFAPGNRNCPPEPAWVAAALKGQPPESSAVETPRDRRERARLARWYRNGEPYGRTAVPGVPYWVHLADGGSLDNAALWPILRGLGSPVSRWGVRELIAAGRVRRVLLIVVNAMKRPDTDTDRRPEGPTLVRMLFSAMTSAQNATTMNSIRTAEALFADLRRRHPRVAFDGPVVVELDAIGDPARRRCFRNVKTALDLPAPQVDALRQVAVEQLEANPRYRAFLKATAGNRVGGLRYPDADGFCSPRTGPGASVAH